MGITLIEPQEINLQIDNQKTIFFLILFASFFNFSGTMVRKFYNIKIENTLEYRLKCFHIIFAAILCYYTIKINIYKHNIFALIFIFFCSIIIIMTEIIKENPNSLKNILIDLGLTLFSGFTREFLDTIEKHLFEFDYLNPFKFLMMGIICCIFSLFLYLYFLIFEDKYNYFYLAIK